MTLKPHRAHCPLSNFKPKQNYSPYPNHSILNRLPLNPKLQLPPNTAKWRNNKNKHPSSITGETHQNKNTTHPNTSYPPNHSTHGLLSLFTRSWLPITNPPRGIIFMIHGYGNDISWTFQGTPIYLAQNGFACFGLDLEGHGQSHGLKAFVPNVDFVVNDCLSYFKFIISQNQEFRDIPKFLFGESMGGAICLLIHFKAPEFFNGAILVAPMCKISEKFKPKWPIPELLTFVSKFAPTLPIVPTADLVDKSVKVAEKRIISGINPLRYRGKPRLGTVIELLRVTDYVSSRLSEVNLPFIVLHGSADVVTDPEVSRELYERAKSEDKCIKIYEGMMHSLLFGETDENIEVVRSDILTWLNHRC